MWCHQVNATDGLSSPLNWSESSSLACRSPAAEDGFLYLFIYLFSCFPFPCFTEGLVSSSTKESVNFKRCSLSKRGSLSSIDLFVIP